MTTTVIRLALFAILSASPALAQTAAPAMPGMSHGGMPGMTPGMAMSPNHMEMSQKMDSMNKAMMGVPMTGDPDQDLVAMMIPHHQGAIEMADIYLRDGKDPEIRRIAQNIIADQKKEIAEFKEWQAKHPVPAR